MQRVRVYLHLENVLDTQRLRAKLLGNHLRQETARALLHVAHKGQDARVGALAKDASPLNIDGVVHALDFLRGGHFNVALDSLVRLVAVALMIFAERCLGTLCVV